MNFVGWRVLHQLPSAIFVGQYHVPLSFALSRIGPWEGHTGGVEAGAGISSGKPCTSALILASSRVSSVSRKVTRTWWPARVSWTVALAGASRRAGPASDRNGTAPCTGASAGDA